MPAHGLHVAARQGIDVTPGRGARVVSMSAASVKAREVRATARRLRGYCESHGIGEEELARKLGITSSRMWSLFSGVVTKLTEAEDLRIAALLGEDAP